MMLILHFAHSFIPMYGGTTTRMCALLTDAAYAHVLIVPRPQGAGGPPVPAVEDFGNIHVRRVDLPTRPRLKGPVLAGHSLAKAQTRRLLEPAADIAADIVHGHNPLPFARSARQCAREKQTRFVYEIHKLGYDSFVPGTGMAGLRQRLRRELNRWKEARIARAADAVIVQTEEIKERVVSLFGVAAHQVSVIPMGVDPDLFNPARLAEDRVRLRRQHGCEGRITFLYNGHLETETGIDFFLETVRTLPEAIQQRMKVLVLGRGRLQSYVADVSAQVPDLIRFLGLIPYEEMPAVYSACDVHVLPYPDMACWQTNVPTKLLEGMAMERLILASDVAGIMRVLNGHGLSYRPEDRGGLEEAVCQIVAHLDTFAARRKAAREAVIQRYDWRLMRDQLQTLYAALAAPQRAPVPVVP